MGGASKAHAAAIGGGVGSALAELIAVFAPQLTDHQAALAILLSAGLAWICTYLAPKNSEPTV